MIDRRVAVVLLVLCTAFVMHSPAEAQGARFRSGELVCDGGRSVGLIIGSNQNLRCVFRSVQTGRRYVYTGRMRRLGLDLGVTSGSRLMWAVLAANTTRVKRATLAGTYVGAAGDASFGLGAGANVLVGGFNRSIALQPLSIQGQVGVNVAVGVASLTLR
jgi:hypothetical protein